MEEKQKWHFFNLYCMAIADGEFAPQELAVLYKIAEEKGFDPKAINEIITTIGPTPVIPTNLEEKITYLYDLVRIAWADGVIEPAERDLMHKYVELFGFDPHNTSDILDYLIENVKAGIKVEDIIKQVKE